ncbi:hypothetical protein NP233_g6595 [Leucocoprinus birnbaumii]|uniref:FIST domain-containing protein n=1 Tax=Leucocoprinus birnbaumii TaxID=56174 RepID=A0AAD5VWB8_9AGAR|nr:hypothetical protein NP233_g6595 [Leucocoprinus birnbaumii]
MTVLHLSTLLARSPVRLLDRIKSIEERYAGHNMTLLFALSANFSDSQQLASAVNALTGLKNTSTLGCLSGRLGNSRIGGANVANDALSLSIAVLDSKNLVTFRSTIPGREEAQVGRWHAFRRKEEGLDKERSLEEGLTWEEVWNGGKVPSLPEGLHRLDPREVQNILYLSDLKPEGLLSSFHHLPDVSKLGLLASSTPFITGRPVTLFKNREIFDSGAVGIAFRGKPSALTRPMFSVDFLDVRTLSEPMIITQCEGNMVNTLNDDNPTQLLLAAIKKSGLDTYVSGSFKEEEQFSLGALSGDGKLDRVYRITAGDPSRGSISIDSPSTPPVGTRVQFIHRPATAIPGLPASRPAPTMSFLTVSDELQSSESDQEDFEILLEGKGNFLAASENGFVFESAEHDGENVKSRPSGIRITRIDDSDLCLNYLRPDGLTRIVNELLELLSVAAFSRTSLLQALNLCRKP